MTTSRSFQQPLSDTKKLLIIFIIFKLCTPPNAFSLLFSIYVIKHLIQDVELFLNLLKFLLYSCYKQLQLLNVHVEECLSTHFVIYFFIQLRVLMRICFNRKLRMCAYKGKKEKNLRNYSHDMKWGEVCCVRNVFSNAHTKEL